MRRLSAARPSWLRKAKFELSACPICGGAHATQVTDRPALEREVERVWMFHARRFRHPVPPIYLTDRVVFSQGPPLRLMRCAHCGHLYRNPRESAETIHRTYREDSTSDRVYDALFENQRHSFRGHARRIRRLSKGINRGLEVGSYVGGFLAAARDHGMSFSGIDVNEDAVDFCRRQGLAVAINSLEDLTGFGKYDAVAIWNTFEQLPNVRSAAIACRRLLQDGGLLALRVPNGSFYARWRRHLNGPLAPLAERMLAHNNLLGFPYREGFTKRSMHRLLSDTGFEIRRVHGDTLVRIADRWTNTGGAIDELVTKTIERVIQRGWRAPWVEVYAVAR